MFEILDRTRVQYLPDNDTRVTCLDDEIDEIRDALTSLDIALSNRDYVSQGVSENVAHQLIATIRDQLRVIGGTE